MILMVMEWTLCGHISGKSPHGPHSRAESGCLMCVRAWALRHINVARLDGAIENRHSHLMPLAVAPEPRAHPMSSDLELCG